MVFGALGLPHLDPCKLLPNRSSRLRIFIRKSVRTQAQWKFEGVALVPNVLDFQDVSKFDHPMTKASTNKR